MTFDLSKAAAAFRDLMNRVLRAYLDQFVVIFIDDILIYSKSLKHERHLAIALETLQQ